ncbi:MAG: TetR/AcrR family transcriptional regulator [Syntrophales bacterium]|nr:TetR/AcrR family transcriptional regulator [Syntrophales bacterium]
MKKDKSGNKTPDKTKKNDTVERVLRSARKIFSEHPYHTASIRMIGNDAGLNYPLIAYYFSTKAALFEAVLVDISEEYYEENAKWLKETAGMGADRGLSVYIDRLIEFNLAHPEAQRILLLNQVQVGESQIVPCYRVLQEFFVQWIPLFKETSSARAADRNIENFAHNFNVLAINYLGAGSFHAGVLGVAPSSPEYKKWVKENLTALFLPLLKQLIRGGAQVNDESEA